MIFFSLALTIGCGIFSFIIYLYFFNKGQFEDIEDIKYQMFTEDRERE